MKCVTMIINLIQNDVFLSCRFVHEQGSYDAPLLSCCNIRISRIKKRKMLLHCYLQLADYLVLKLIVRPIGLFNSNSRLFQFI